MLIKEEETKVTWEMLDTNDLVPTLNDIELNGVEDVDLNDDGNFRRD